MYVIFNHIVLSEEQTNIQQTKFTKKTPFLETINPRCINDTGIDSYYFECFITERGTVALLFAVFQLLRAKFLSFRDVRLERYDFCVSLARGNIKFRTFQRYRYPTQSGVALLAGDDAGTPPLSRLLDSCMVAIQGAPPYSHRIRTKPKGQSPFN
ncbi:hypothetical protein GWI33_004937 [Rhynchophorus ferrugineus]|uniref:Uncharacterized protein n=1 Tax=Rhynchophorus ferrugineus TaxID=354439 RepID=A0A834IUB1_RHYFE|nr:hypothetical protein GWI33_004937 [Rhynchophorus ferrugineus]